MNKKIWKKSPQDLQEIFYSSMEEFPSVELRKMFGYPCAFLNGNMMTGLHEENFAIRLPSLERQKALDSKQGNIFAPMKGRIMKEYLALSKNIIDDKKKLHAWLLKSFDYTNSLPKKEKKS
ncbi:MAG: TfoX/Sxy family protein [Myxococcales bacterium]|nr:TfoX/Sxy family protein [Myxococcales bacterium]USN49985.1 MAG: TfoX/Sxy family protein [Myxococcales bacterium]